MPIRPDLLTVAEAATSLGLSPVSVRSAIRRGVIAAVRIDARTNGIPPAEIERYRREHLRQRRGRRSPRRPTEELPQQPSPRQPPTTQTKESEHDNDSTRHTRHHVHL